MIGAAAATPDAAFLAASGTASRRLVDSLSSSGQTSIASVVLPRPPRARRLRRGRRGRRGPGSVRHLDGGTAAVVPHVIVSTDDGSTATASSSPWVSWAATRRRTPWRGSTDDVERARIAAFVDWPRRSRAPRGARTCGARRRRRWTRTLANATFEIRGDVSVTPILVLEYGGVGIGILFFLGLCRECAHITRQYWRCPTCGATRPYVERDVFHQDGPYAIERVVTEERCDSGEKACVNSHMKLIVRRRSWWLSRPFAWVWAPMPALLDGLRSLRSTASQKSKGE